VTTLTAAEVRTIREGLGVTAEWFAAQIGVTPRTVQRWESGESEIKPSAAEAILTLEADAAEQVAVHLAAFTSSRSMPPVLVVEDMGRVDDWPPGWLRMVAFRVRQRLPGLRIVDAAGLAETRS